MNYEVEQKRHWRYWVWKRIAQSCGVHPSFATVLFLSGPSPSDLQAATKYGFKLRNIVAVDTDLKCVKAAREKGCTAIQGTLHEIAAKWSDGPIHGILADYCGGLTFRSALESYQMASITNACAFNFQRGRECDKGSREFRKICNCIHRGEQMQRFINVMWIMANYWIDHFADHLQTFNRIFLDATTPYAADPLGTGSRLRLEEQESWFIDTLSDIDETLKERNHSLAQALDECVHSPESPKWEMYSYRSNVVRMDTIVGSFESVKNARSLWNETLDRTAIDRRLAAVKAIRTMNGAVKMHAASN